MRHHTVALLDKRWGKKIGAVCASIDAQMAGRRGPTAAVSTYSLIAGLVYLALENKPVHILGLARELKSARVRDLKLLGLDCKPTYRQLCYQLERIHRLAQSASVREEAVQELLDALVPPSATDARATDTWAIDTHLFEAWVNQRTVNRKPADPDASWRVLDTHKYKNRPVLGYQLVAAVRTGTTEVCDRITITTAKADDAPKGAELACALAKDGHNIKRVIADRGFSQKPQSFLDPIRSAGIHVTYDFKESDLGVCGTLHGNLVVDGWVYSPALPARLRSIKKPGPGSSPAEWAKFNRLMDLREPYQWLAHGKPDASKARIASPASRNRLRCKVAKNTAPDAAPTCRVKHQAGEACDMTTMTFTAANAPRNFQYPIWGTSEWNKIWKQRSAVERFFGHLQAPSGVAFDHGRFRVRHLPKVAFLTAAFVIATNISLIESSSVRAAKAAQKAVALSATSIGAAQPFSKTRPTKHVERKTTSQALSVLKT